jgi:hypothetical protein
MKAEWEIGGDTDSGQSWLTASVINFGGNYEEKTRLWRS